MIDLPDDDLPNTASTHTSAARAHSGGPERRRRGRPPATRDEAAEAAQDLARALLHDCIARDLLESVELATRFNVSRATVSRFNRGHDRFPAKKLSALDAFLRNVASGRIVLPPRPRKIRGALRAEQAAERARKAETLLASLPATARSHLEQIEALRLGQSGVALLERALLLLAVRRCGANLTTTGGLLNVSRKEAANAWSKLERSRGVSSPLDPRTEEERLRREQMAAELLEPIHPVFQAFAHEVIDGLTPNAGSKLTFAREILRARAIPPADSEPRPASKAAPRDALQSAAPMHARPRTSLRAALERLAQDFAHALVGAIVRAAPSEIREALRGAGSPSREPIGGAAKVAVVPERRRRPRTAGVEPAVRREVAPPPIEVPLLDEDLEHAIEDPEAVLRGLQLPSNTPDDVLAASPSAPSPVVPPPQPAQPAVVPGEDILRSTGGGFVMRRHRSVGGSRGAR